MQLKSILNKNMMTKNLQNWLPANQGQITGADSANFWVSRILGMFLFKMDFRQSRAQTMRGPSWNTPTLIVDVKFIHITHDPFPFKNFEVWLQPNLACLIFKIHVQKYFLKNKYWLRKNAWLISEPVTNTQCIIVRDPLWGLVWSIGKPKFSRATSLRVPYSIVKYSKNQFGS